MPHRLSPSRGSPIHMLDDGCLVRILNFLTPLPDRFNAARVCRRWLNLASHPRMWLRVDGCSAGTPGVFPNIQEAVDEARPGDTILIASGAAHEVSNVHLDKPLCLMGGGAFPDDTVLLCPRGVDSALEFTASCKVMNLTIQAELGSCLLHRKGRLTVEGCFLKCIEHPLEHLCCPIVSTADEGFPTAISKVRSDVSVVETRIEGGSGAVKVSGGLQLQQVRVMYARAALVFWFTVAQTQSFSDLDTLDSSMVPCNG